LENKIDDVTEERNLKAATIMLKALANERRLQILNMLYTQSKTWTELMFGLEINPKSLRDNLMYLRKCELVKKREPVGFELTEAGQAVMELSLKDIIGASQSS
jgi:DNA-binding HxlR family transcriptional regulator